MLDQLFWCKYGQHRSQAALRGVFEEISQARDFAEVTIFVVLAIGCLDKWWLRSRDRQTWQATSKLCVLAFKPGRVRL